jgi:tripartite-type tricarboxylate transporter receptor subunit TctC
MLLKNLVLGLIYLIVSMHGTTIAQEKLYPNKAIRLVVPYPPGGSTDNLARVISNRWGENLKQSIVIENRGGASGNIGVDVVAKSSNDGYTIGLFDTAFVINPSLFKKLPFDTLKDFDSVMFVAVGPVVLVVNPTFGVTSMKELINKVQAQPGIFSFASAGSGTAMHLAGEMLKSSQRVQLMHVPYKGGGPAIADVVAGHVTMLFSQPGSVLGLIQQGKLVAIGMSGDKRWQGLPRVPTFTESGYSGMKVNSSWQVMVPTGTSRAVINLLSTSLKKTLLMDDIRDKLTEMGYLIISSDPENSYELLKLELDSWSSAVKASGASID